MTVQDAMSQVKNELGAEAVILHTRKVKKGGFLGFFAKEVVEIMAAIEDVQEVAKSKIAGNESREPIKKKKLFFKMKKQIITFIFQIKLQLMLIKRKSL